MIVAVCPKCGTDLEALIYTTYPPIHAYRCRKCGWTQEERENITRVPIATVERKPITNYDKLISKSPEEMAAWLDEHDKYNAICPDYGANCQEKSCRKCWLDWLKQEAKE